MTIRKKGLVEITIKDVNNTQLVFMKKQILIRIKNKAKRNRVHIKIKQYKKNNSLFYQNNKSKLFYVLFTIGVELYLSAVCILHTYIIYTFFFYIYREIHTCISPALDIAHHYIPKIYKHSRIINTTEALIVETAYIN